MREALEVTVERGSTRLWARVDGEIGGVPVVLAMGAGASSIWWPSVLLDDLVDLGHSVVTFDARDVGLSTHATQPYDLDDLAGDLDAVIEACGFDSAHLVGISMGGMTAQRLAILRPGRVRSLVLLATSSEPASPRLGGRDPAVVAVASESASTVDEYIERETRLRLLLTGSAIRTSADDISEMLRADLHRGINTRCRHAVAVFTAQGWTSELSCIDAPTTVVHGSEDRVFPLAHGRELARTIPRARLVVWRGVGHEIPPQRASELTSIISETVSRASADTNNTSNDEEHRS